MTTEPLNPSVTPLYQERFAENTAGVIAAITACIVAAGGTVVSYPSNTAGVIQALMDLRTAISGSGPVVPTDAQVLLPMTAGEALALGDAVYLANDGLVYKAGSTTTRNAANVLGLARAAAAAAGAVVVVARGKIEGLSGLTPGGEYFLGTGGAYSTTAPTGSGNYLTMIGQALSASTLDVQPQTPMLLS